MKFIACILAGILLGAVISYANASGPLNPSEIKSGNIFITIWGKNSSGGNVWYGCVVRPDANGIWGLEGGNHHAVGCSRVTQNSTSITITYPTLSRVVTSSIDSDETLTINGYSAGASVGLSSSVINIGQ